MAISVVAQPAYFNLVRRFAPELLSRDGDEVALKELTEHIVESVRAGLAAADTQGAGRPRARSRRRVRGVQ
jgi:hypothetical protein